MGAKAPMPARVNPGSGPETGGIPGIHTSPAKIHHDHGEITEMKLQAKGTNVIVLYGDGAIAHFSDMMNRWSTMLPASQWDALQFILVGSQGQKLKLEQGAAALVNARNTRFFRFDEPALTAMEYHNLIFDKVRTGDVLLHAICDSGEKEISYDWLRKLISAAMSIQALTSHVMYYLLIGRNSMESEQQELLELVNTEPGAVFFLGDMNESGGKVSGRDRWNAAGLVTLMNCVGKLPVKAGTSAYSLGYTALNANGSELIQLNESAACRAIIEELSHPVTSNAQIVNQLDLLPDGVGSVQEIRRWLQEYIQQNTPQINPVALKNAWITIRMDPELPSGEAVRRMKRFVDLNFTGEQSVGNLAKELAWRTESTVRARLCGSVITASLADSVMAEIVEAFHRLKTEDIEPGGCTYPKKPLKFIFGKGTDEYLSQCKTAVMKPIREYITARNISVFASELEKAYRRLAEWVTTARGEGDLGYRRVTAQELLQDIQKELDNGDAGNALRLEQKYRNYARELGQIHPPLAVLTEDIRGQYFNNDGKIIESEWQELIHKAGRNMVRKLPGEYKGDFFRVLSSEFSSADEREKFFDEYLQNGPRMFMHLQANQSSGTTVYLVDDHLMDKWFVGDIYEVKTDNAENLTLYPLGSEPARFYLEDKTAYFKGTGTGTTMSGSPVVINRGDEFDLFGGDAGDSGMSAADNAPVEEQQPEKTSMPAANGVRLEPDEKGNYRLFWPWHGNDPTAMVEITQYGEKVGKIAVIPVLQFKNNGDNMNITDDVMGGKPIPAGTLTIRIRDSRKDVYIDSVDLPGRRDVVRYKVTGSMLQMKPDNRKSVEKLVLRTTDTDGVQVFYPLYPSRDDKTWLYQGLMLSDGKIVEDPTCASGQICTINVME